MSPAASNPASAQIMGFVTRCAGSNRQHSMRHSLMRASRKCSGRCERHGTSKRQRVSGPASGIPLIEGNGESERTATFRTRAHTPSCRQTPLDPDASLGCSERFASASTYTHAVLPEACTRRMARFSLAGAVLPWPASLVQRARRCTSREWRPRSVARRQGLQLEAAAFRQCW
jgi:hypothetical protein